MTISGVYQVPSVKLVSMLKPTANQVLINQTTLKVNVYLAQLVSIVKAPALPPQILRLEPLN